MAIKKLVFLMGMLFYAFGNLQAQAPVISYTPLANTCTEGSRTLIATITSPDGIPTSGPGLPVLYWSFNATNDQPVVGLSLGNDQYSFTFGTGAFAGSVVSYYIVAQSNAAIPTVSVYPSTGAAGLQANPPSVTTAPTIQDFYVIQPTLTSGTYLVGTGQVYTTITDAVNAYNNSCLNGPVIFALTDVAFGANESFPILISNPNASAVNTLTIKPNTGITTTITGTADALFKFNGADYVTFEGSNAGTTTRNMTIQNNSTNSNAVCFWLSSFSSSNGSTFNTVRNCNIYGYVPTTSTPPTLFAGIAVSSGVVVSSNSDAPNSNNNFINNNINTTQHGIYINGALSGEGSNVITGNIIGSATTGKKIGYRSLFLANQNNVLVNNNQIIGVSCGFYSGSEADASGGIVISGSCSGGKIYNNMINDIRNTYNLGAPSYAISLQATSVFAALDIYNNFIYLVTGYGKNTVASENGIAIAVLSGGGYNLFFNSINLATNQTLPGITACLYIGPSVSGTIDIRNNIFSNRQSTGTRYAIYNLKTSAVFNTINFNDYFSNGQLAFQGNNISNLISWQAATGADGGSVSVDPLFTTATNLNLQNGSPLNDQGTPIAGITTDYYNVVRSTTNPDIGAFEFTPPACTGNLGGTAVTSSSTYLCVSGQVVLSCSGFSFGAGISYQWQSSTDSLTWVNATGETNPTSANPPTISTTTFYRLRVICAAGTPGYSNVVKITVKNPQITSVAGASRCGTGALTLTANSNSETTVQWYTAAIGGAPLSTGNTFNTPTLNGTTTYYAEPAFIGSSGTCGPLRPSSVAGAVSYQLTPWNVNFDVLNATTLASIDVFPATVGDAFTIEIYNSDNVLIGSSPFVTTVSGGATAQTVPLNIFLRPGTNYYMYINPGESGTLGFGLSRNISGAVYPYSSSDIVITGNGFNSTYYMCFYNWRFLNGCTVPRSPVVATIGIAADITINATETGLCAGSSTTLTATSSNALYNYTWTPGGSSGSSVNVTPASNTIYTVTGSDGTCTNNKSIEITVNAAPTPIAITPLTPTICNGSTATLSTTGGAVSSTFLINEKFEGSGLPFGWDTLNTNVSSAYNLICKWQQKSSVYVYSSLSNGNIAFKSNDSSKFFIANSDRTGSQTLNTALRMPKLNFTGYSGAQLSFWHHYSPFFSPDSINIEKSKNGSTSWTTIYKAGPSTAPYAAGHPNVGVATAIGSPLGSSTSWVQKVIDLTPFLNTTAGYVDTFYIRFRYVGKANFWWAIDNVQITGTGGSPIVWTPSAGLYTNVAGTAPYVAGSFATTIYAGPTSNTTYTATSSSPNGCAAVASVPVAVRPLVSATVSGTRTICPGTSAQVSVALTGVAPWRIVYSNGTTSTTVTGINTSNYVFNVTPAATTTYTVTSVQDANGCTALSANITGSAVITVGAIAASINGNISVCPGASASIPITLTGSSPWNLTYSNGTVNTTITGITTSPYDLTVTPAVNTTYTLTALSDAAGCNAPLANLSGNAVVNIRSTATATISGISPICAGSSSSMSVALTGTGPWDLTYTNGTTPTTVNGITSSPYLFTVGPTTNTTYSITALSDGNGCVSPASGYSTTAAVNIRPLVTGTLSGNAAICEQGSAQLTATFTGVSPWSFSYTLNGTNPVSVNNVNSSPYSFTVSPSVNTTYALSAVTDGNGCTAAISGMTSNASITINVSSTTTWTGTSTNWFDASNWCGGIPTAAKDVLIPTGLSNYPNLIAGAAVCRNLTLQSNTTLTIANGAGMSISGNTVNDGSLINNGRVTLNGTSAQSFPGGTSGVVSKMNLLEVNKDGSGADGNVTFNRKFPITDTGMLSLQHANIVTLLDTITIKSTATGTARIDSVGSEITIAYAANGAFTVERYFPTGILHGKSWQLLSTPTFGQTIKQAWQEGAVGVSDNPRPGYGTTITSNLSGATTALGFDFLTPLGGTMKVYDVASNTYIGVPSTSVQIANPKGYMFFVRGDRSVVTGTAPANQVTLRTTGKIYYGNGTDSAVSLNIPAGKFQSAGNPYASPIDFMGVLAVSNGINPSFYVWDPMLQSGQGLGAFQTLSFFNNWQPIPGGTANYGTADVISRIQSGQAFFIYSGTGGTIRFREQAKVAGSRSVYRVSNNRSFLRTNLYDLNNQILDGNVLALDSFSSNGIDENDAPKLSNFGENFSIQNNGNNYSIDARLQIFADDTIRFSVSNLKQQSYQFKLVPEHFQGLNLTPYFIDRYNGTSVPVSLIDPTIIGFSVDAQPASKASNRFCIVFRQLRALPVTFLNVEAVKKSGYNQVYWRVTNERSIDHYDVEKSIDGTSFYKIGAQSPQSTALTAEYYLNDVQPVAGNNFYRIKAYDASGNIDYSEVVKLWIDKAISPKFTLMPNPVKGHVIRIGFENQLPGTYLYAIHDASGKLVQNGEIAHLSGTNQYQIKLVKTVSAGVYNISFKDAESRTTTIRMVVAQ